MLNKKTIGAFVAAATLLSGFAFASLPPVALASTPSASNVEQADDHNSGFSLAKMYGTTDGVGLLYSIKNVNHLNDLFLYRQMLKDSEAARMQSSTGKLDAASEKLLESVRVELDRSWYFFLHTAGGDDQHIQDFQNAWSAVNSASTPQELKNAYSNVLSVAEKWYSREHDSSGRLCANLSNPRMHDCSEEYEADVRSADLAVANLKKANSSSYEDPCVPTLSKNIYSDYAQVPDRSKGMINFVRVKYAGFATYDEYVASFNCSGNSSAIGSEHHNANPSDDHGLHSNPAGDGSDSNETPTSEPESESASATVTDDDKKPEQNTEQNPATDVKPGNDKNVNAPVKVPAAPKTVNELKQEVKGKIIVGNNNVAKAGAPNRVTVHSDNAKFNKELKEKGSVKSHAFIYSTPKLLRGVDGSDYVTVKLGADGVPYFDAQFPAGYSGKHTVVLVDEQGNQLAWTDITVVNNTAGQGDGRDVLPVTGVAGVLVAFAALMFAASGAVLRKVRS